MLFLVSYWSLNEQSPPTKCSLAEACLGSPLLLHSHTSASAPYTRVFGAGYTTDSTQSIDPSDAATLPNGERNTRRCAAAYTSVYCSGRSVLQPLSCAHSFRALCSARMQIVVTASGRM